MRDVIVNGESSDELIRLFTSSDKATRLKIAAAFGKVNIKLSHDEGSNFDERRDEFCEKVKDHEAAMQNALFECLGCVCTGTDAQFHPAHFSGVDARRQTKSSLYGSLGSQASSSPLGKAFFGILCGRD